MDNIFLYDLRRFFNLNLKKIVSGALIFAVLYAVFQFVFGSMFPINNEQIDGNQVQMTEEGVRPAYSQFYIEYEDGTVFTNTRLIEEYLFMPEVLADLQQETGINFESILEEANEMIEVEEEERRIFYLYRDHASSTFNFFIQTGNETDNLAVMTYYYGLIIDQEIPVLQPRSVYEINEPMLHTVEEEEPVDLNREAPGLTDTLLDFLIGFILGAIILTVLLLILAVLGTKMRYTFSYNRNEEDLFLLYDKRIRDKSELRSMVLQPATVNKAFISQYELSEETKAAISPSFEREIGTENAEAASIVAKNDFAEIPASFEFDEAILIVQGEKTDKSWYRKQRRLLNNYQARVKVIHVNEMNNSH